MQILSITISKSHVRQDFVAECAVLSLQLPKQYHMQQFLQQNHTSCCSHQQQLYSGYIVVCDPQVHAQVPGILTTSEIYQQDPLPL
uniref:Uncharacterized protein n=1 Tax=Arundo donax TaxID=35708 RepID=A0A0A9ER85_ARUDO